MLKRFPFKVVSSDDIENLDDFQVKETGKTFRQNAILKAKAFAKKTNLLTLGDDSGLEIDFLNGQPGIYSARFAQGDFKLACRRLLDSLADVPQSRRQARFVCCLALYHPQTKVLKTFTGTAEGWIAPRPRGENGFGYDPIFFSSVLDKTFAQATSQEKNQTSHRAQALKKLKKYFNYD